MRTIKQSCLDRVILFGEAGLHTAIREFVAHYHLERNHQGIGNRLIDSTHLSDAANGSIRRRKRLGGMLNYYERAAIMKGHS